MAAIALLKFIQGTRQPSAGRALIVLPSVITYIENGGDNSSVKSWRIELLDHPTGQGSALPGVPQLLAENANSSTPDANITPGPATSPGCYRIRLRVWTDTSFGGTVDTDIRNICVLSTNRSIVLPPYQKLPDPLPLPGEGKPGEKPDELNFEGQPWGWSGPTDYGAGGYGSEYAYFRLLNASLYWLDVFTSGTSLVPNGSALGQFLYWTGSAWEYTDQTYTSGSLSNHVASPFFDVYRGAVTLVGAEYQSVPGYSVFQTLREWHTDHYEPRTFWRSLALKGIEGGSVGQVIAMQYDSQDAAIRVRWSRAGTPPTPLSQQVTALVWDASAQEAYWYAFSKLPSGSASGAGLWWNSVDGQWQASSGPSAVGEVFTSAYNGTLSYYYALWATVPIVPAGTTSEVGEMLYWNNTQWVISSIPPNTGGYIPYIWNGGALNWLPLAAGTTDELVKVSANDTDARHLEDKLTAGSGIALTVVNEGGDEDLRVGLVDGVSTYDVLQWTGSVWTTGTVPLVHYTRPGAANPFPYGAHYLFGSTGSPSGGTWTRNIDLFVDSNTIGVDKLVNPGGLAALIVDSGDVVGWVSGSEGEFLGVSGGEIGFYAVGGTVPDGTAVGHMLWWNGSAWVASNTPGGGVGEPGVPYYMPHATTPYLGFADVSGLGADSGVLRWYGATGDLSFQKVAPEDLADPGNYGSIIHTCSDGSGGRQIKWSTFSVSTNPDNYVLQWQGDYTQSCQWVQPSTVWNDGAPSGSDTEDVLRWNGATWQPGDAFDPNAIHDNVSGEIAAVAEKTSTVNTDLVLIEDSAASNAKKRVQVGNLLSIDQLTPGSDAQGDLLYRDVSGWQRLSAGVAGQVLQSGGPAANPSWVTPVTGSGTDHHIARWDVATGALQDSTAVIDDNGNLSLDTTGSTPAAPRTLSFTALSGGEAMRMGWGTSGIQSNDTGAITQYSASTLWFRAFSGGVPTFDGAEANTSAIFVNSTLSYKALVVRGAASQSAQLQEWQNSAGTELAGISGVGNLRLRSQREVQFWDDDNSHYVAFKAPAGMATSAYVFTLPSSYGNTGYALVDTDGGGTLGWAALISGTGVDKRITRWSGTGAIQNSSATLDDYGRILLDATVSDASNPAGMLIQGFTTGDYYRWGVADNDGIQSEYSRAVQMYAYNTIVFRGGRGTTAPAFEDNITSIAHLFIMPSNTRTGLVVRASSSPSVNVASWQTSAGADMVAIGALGNVSLYGQRALRFYDDDDSAYIGFRAPSGMGSTNYTHTWPANYGTSGQVLRTSGDGTLSWVDMPSPGSGAGMLATCPAASCDIFTFAVENGYTNGGAVIPAGNLTINTIKVLCTQAQAGETVRAAVYNSGGTRLQTTPTVSCGTTGLKTMTLSSSVALTAGTLYYVAITTDGGTNVRFAGHASASFNISPYFSFRNTTGYLPDPLNPTGTPNGVPWISLSI